MFWPGLIHPSGECFQLRTVALKNSPKLTTAFIAVLSSQFIATWSFQATIVV